VKKLIGAVQKAMDAEMAALVAKATLEAAG
jgi:hypothetical protein